MTSPSLLFHDTYYHIYNRGVNREDVFIEERNYGYFLLLYTKYIQPVAQTFAYCLLKNHFHLLVRIKAEEEIQLPQSLDQTLRVSETLRVSRDLYPSKKFSDFLNAYAKSINKAYGRTGTSFNIPSGVCRLPATASSFGSLHTFTKTHKSINSLKIFVNGNIRHITRSFPKSQPTCSEVLCWIGLVARNNTSIFIHPWLLKDKANGSLRMISLNPKGLQDL